MKYDMKYDIYLNEIRYEMQGGPKKHPGPGLHFYLP